MESLPLLRTSPKVKGRAIPSLEPGALVLPLLQVNTEVGTGGGAGWEQYLCWEGKAKALDLSPDMATNYC